jgi:serine/threonine protein phosphatase PrpC
VTEEALVINAIGSGQHVGAPWRHVGASHTGASHLRDDLPCQDRLRCELVPSAHGPVLLAVVADGAGSASEGARGAEIACARLVDWLRPGVDLIKLDMAGAWIRDGIEQTRTAVLGQAELMELPPRELASTLICAVIADDWSIFAQIGDGAIVRRAPESREWSYAFR